jgi:transcription elongation factor Elf1
MVRYTSSLGSMKCPVCGRRGQLKIRRSHLQYDCKEFVVDHFKKGNNHASGWDHSCYVGVADVELAQRLYRLNSRKKILIEVA